MQSLTRAIGILRIFETDSECLRLIDIAQRTGIHKSSAHRMVAALVDGGLLARVDQNRYKLAIRHFGKKGFRLGCGMLSSEFSFDKAVKEGLQKSAATANVELLILDNEDSAQRTLHNADVFIKEGVDLVIEFQADARIAGQLSDKFHAAAIPVIALEIPQPRAIFYGANNVKAGLMAGRHLSQWAAANWRGQIDELLLLELPKAGHIPNARILGSMLGVLERLAWVSQQQIKILHTTGHYDNSVTLVRRHLMRSKAQRILVAAINDTAALGALHAFRDLGREEHCAIVGHNASNEAGLEIIARNSRLVGCVGYFPERYGEALIPLALDILAGQDVPQTNFIKHEMITPQNIDSFYPFAYRLSEPQAQASTHRARTA
jgi:ribose transport system substrate-binding protein